MTVEKNCPDCEVKLNFEVTNSPYSGVEVVFLNEEVHSECFPSLNLIEDELIEELAEEEKDVKNNGIW